MPVRFRTEVQTVTMALPLTVEVSVHDLVVEASARTYGLQGYAALTRHQLAPRLYGKEPFDVVVPEIPRVEQVVSADSLPRLDLKRLRQCRREGIQVWVLVPLDAIGQAHTRLRGVVDHIVPFWLVDDQQVRFGPPRLA
jgi:hypothetical protein